MRETIEEKAARYAQTHQRACESWSHGKVTSVQMDRLGCVCIQYESGAHWHYKDTPGGVIWW